MTFNRSQTKITTDRDSDQLNYFSCEVIFIRMTKNSSKTPIEGQI